MPLFSHGIDPANARDQSTQKSQMWTSKTKEKWETHRRSHIIWFAFSGIEKITYPIGFIRNDNSDSAQNGWFEHELVWMCTYTMYWTGIFCAIWFGSVRLNLILLSLDVFLHFHNFQNVPHANLFFFGWELFSLSHSCVLRFILAIAFPLSTPLALLSPSFRFLFF